MAKQVLICLQDKECAMTMCKGWLEICMSQEIIREAGIGPRTLELKVVPFFSKCTGESFNKPIDTIYLISYRMVQKNTYIR